VTPAAPAEGLDLAVRAVDVRKRFGRVEALRGLSLEARGPQVFGLVGPDGAGKTTLLRVLAGLVAHDAGEVSVLGVDPREDPAALKPRLGYVPQAFSLYPMLTVDENLDFVARCHRLRGEAVAERRRRLLSLARLSRFAGARAETLSGGMKQKLALCAALLPSPPLLILDEPTSGVDVHARAEFWAVIREEARRSIVILATNYLDEAERCDRILYMLEGRSVATGPAAEIRRACDVRVFSASVAGRAEGEVAAALAGAAGLDRIERAHGSVRIESRLGERAVADRLASAFPGLAARIEEREPDLETALLALERRARSA
jgi:ABC-2 type transport system ATP-binding protein